MEVKDAVAILLREDATNEELFKALSVCLKTNHAVTVAHVLKRGLTVCREETLAHIVHATVVRNPVLHQKALSHFEQKETVERDKRLRASQLSTTPNAQRNRPQE